MPFRTYCLLLFFVSISTSILAQDYRLFFKERNTFFEGGNRVFSLDSFSVEANEEKWMNVMPSTMCSTDFHPSDTSMLWLQDAFLYDTNTGKYAFLNYALDTVIIQSQASIGETWIMYQYPDSSYLEASVIGLNETSIFGTVDSAKEIILQAYSPDGTAKSDVWNGTILKWSKAHGVLQFFNIYTFPQKIDTMRTIGLSNPDQGFTGLTDTDFSQLEVGDEWHTKYKSYSSYQEGETYKRFEIVSVQGNDTYWVHTQKGHSNRYDYEGGDSGIDTTYHDTTLIMHLEPPALSEQKIPFELKNEGVIAYKYANEWNRWEKDVRYLQGMEYQSIFNTSWTDCVYWEPSANGAYSAYLIEGFPVVNFSGYSGTGRYKVKSSLRIIYFKDGQGEFGQEVNFQPFIDYRASVPDSVDLIEEIVEDTAEGTAIFPNPIKDRLNFRVDPQQYEGPIQMTIFNMYGQQVLNKTVQVNIPIFLDKLAFGIYQVYLIHDGEVIFQDKIKKL